MTLEFLTLLNGKPDACHCTCRVTAVKKRGACCSAPPLLRLREIGVRNELFVARIEMTNTHIVPAALFQRQVREYST
jgi:hypothetical protein